MPVNGADRTSLFVGSILLALLICAMWSESTSAEAPLFQAITRDDRRISGRLIDGKPSGLQLLPPDGPAISLDKFQSLERPHAPRSLPDRGWKRLTLINGDVLHAKPIPVAEAPTAGQPALLSSVPTKWMTGFGRPVTLPFAALAGVSHPHGTRCLSYHDFETNANGWVNQTGGNISPNREHARSGTFSLKCGETQPLLRCEFAQPLNNGWSEFSFFVDPDANASADILANFQMSGLQSTSEIQVKLLGPESWYELALPPGADWQRHSIARRPGWHTLYIALQSGEIRLVLDEFPLAEGRMAAPNIPRLCAVKVTASKSSSAVWIDDFAVTTAIAESPVKEVQREQDQLDLATGDQLFGRLLALDTDSVTLEADGRQSRTAWRDIDRLQLAAKPTVPKSVAGWIIHLDLQPWNSTPDARNADSLRGALLSVNSESCVVDHAFLGNLTIPWRHVRRIRPSHHGELLTLEGRLQHLGNEVKSAFQATVPHGTRLARSFDLEKLPNGTAFVTITAIDLEPSAKGTREHPLLKQLRAGGLTSELWVNERRISTLNQEVTGRGTIVQPQRMRIKLPPAALRSGKNQVEIRLQPSRGNTGEFDDWELRELSLEIETPPDLN